MGSPDASDHTEHDGEYPEDGEPQVGQYVGAQHLSVVYPSLLSNINDEKHENDVILRIFSSVGLSFRLLVEEYELESRQILD